MGNKLESFRIDLKNAYEALNTFESEHAIDEVRRFTALARMNLDQMNFIVKMFDVLSK